MAVRPQDASEGGAPAAPATALADDVLASVVSIICQVGRTWRAGDGHVFVLPVSAAIRISTGEQGEAVLC